MARTEKAWTEKAWREEERVPCQPKDSHVTEDSQEKRWKNHSEPHEVQNEGKTAHEKKHCLSLLLLPVLL